MKNTGRPSLFPRPPSGSVVHVVDKNRAHETAVPRSGEESGQPLGADVPSRTSA